MTSRWFRPTLIQQYPESGADNVHVSWLESNNFSNIRDIDNMSIRTIKDLVHIARDPRHDVLQKTYFLKLTGFDFYDINEPILGIEARLLINRGGRITDDTVQLCLNDNLIGKNMASLDLGVDKIYGGEIDTWGTDLTMTDIQNSSFGIILRFQSHPRWPHKTSPLIDAVEIRIH